MRSTARRRSAARSPSSGTAKPAATRLTLTRAADDRAFVAGMMLEAGGPWIEAWLAAEPSRNTIFPALLLAGAAGDRPSARARAGIRAARRPARGRCLGGSARSRIGGETGASLDPARDDVDRPRRPHLRRADARPYRERQGPGAHSPDRRLRRALTTRGRGPPCIRRIRRRSPRSLACSREFPDRERGRCTKGRPSCSR